MEELKYVVFRLGEEQYGINLQHIMGIEQDYHIIPVPNAPMGIKGIINLRGSVIPVYSLRERFGMNPEVTNPERSILITQSAGITVAYEVDAVEEIETVTEDAVNSMPSVVSNDETAFMEQVLRIGQQIVIVINVDGVLSEESNQAIQKIIEEHQ